MDSFNRGRLADIIRFGNVSQEVLIQIAGLLDYEVKKPIGGQTDVEEIFWPGGEKTPANKKSQTAILISMRRAGIKTLADLQESGQRKLLHGTTHRIGAARLTMICEKFLEITGKELPE